LEALTFEIIKGSNIAANNIVSNLNLITSGANGTTISWSSSNTAYIKTDGTVIRPGGDESVTLTATFSKGEASDTKTFSLTVRARQVTGIAVKTQPADLTYTAGQTLDLAGLAVTLTYNDSSILDVGYEDFSYMGITANPAHGTALTVADHHNRPVAVTYNGYAVYTDNLTVTEAASRFVTGIAVKTQPADLTYTAGQALDLAGLAVTLTYNDSTTPIQMP
jgi:hypothetical protein